MTDPRRQVDFDLLTTPISRDLIQWRAKSLTNDKTKALALAYVESRPLMVRLDDACGPGGWCDDYKEFPSGKLACGIGILIDGEWVWKWDGAGADEDIGDKGTFTDAFKRVCVKWNIGGIRGLYDLPKVWVACETYVGGDGKERFSRFTDDPWDYMDNAPRKSANGKPPSSAESLDMEAPLGFGKKHRETPIRKVPTDYIVWMVENAKADKWKSLAVRILEARKMNQLPAVKEEDLSQDTIGNLYIPELKVFEDHLKPAAWMALLGERYSISQQLAPGQSPIPLLSKQDQEDLLEYLQAERNTRGAYVKDAETGKEVIKALFPDMVYRTLSATDMAALRPILEAHWKISQARDSIDGARIIIQGYEKKERESIYATSLLNLRAIIEAINGQVEPVDEGEIHF